MNAMPPMVRHTSSGAPGVQGRSPARADAASQEFGAVMSEGPRQGATSGEIDAAEHRWTGDEACAACEADPEEETPEASADAAQGLLPMLGLVLAQERPPRETSPQGAGTAIGRTQPRETEADASRRARTAANLAATTPGTAASGEARPAAKPGGEAPDRDFRRIDLSMAQPVSPQGGGTAAAASASLSLLARLNLMSTQAGRTPAAEAGTAPGDTPADIISGAADAEAGDPADPAASRVKKASAGDAASDGSAGRRDLPDATGRAAERAAPAPAALPQPGQPASVPAQVVQALAAGTAETGPVRAFVAADRGDASAGGTVQSLKIQLRPHELGQVTAKLSLNGDQLSIEIEVDTIEAHRKLSNESETIVKALRAQGIAVDQVTIQQPSQPNATARDGGGADTPAFSGRDARDSGNSGNPAGRNQPYDSPDRDHGQETRSTAESHASGVRGSGSVYI